jgi:hypothetical protein
MRGLQTSPVEQCRGCAAVGWSQGGPSDQGPKTLFARRTDLPSPLAPFEDGCKIAENGKVWLAFDRHCECGRICFDK